MEYQLSLLKSTPPPARTNKKNTAPRKKKPSSASTWKIFIDGASRGNPGLSGAGVYIACDDEVRVEKGIFLGKRTNNQAEYLALALSMFFLKKEHVDNKSSIVITSDSELLVRQMKNKYRIKDKTLQKIKQLIDTLLKDLSPTFEHVLRVNNKKADALANQGVDKKTPMPKMFQTLLSRYVESPE